MKGKLRSDIIVILVVNVRLFAMGKYTDTFSIVPAEHVISYLIENYVKNVKEPAISDHLLQCNCLVNFDHFDSLA